jgi:hypothetical protein
MLVALATGPVAGAGGCGGASISGFGDVMLSVTVPGDVLVRAADYTVDDDGRVLLSGTIESPTAVHDLAKLITHVPAGDYVVRMRADSTDQRSTCEGMASIKVMKGATARIHVDAACRGAGHVVVGFGVDCLATALVDLLVSPLTAPVGESVLADAVSARDGGGALSYAWSAPSGTFSDPMAGRTSFTCAQPGEVQLTVEAANTQACSQKTSAVVTCVPAPDGGVDGGTDAVNDGLSLQ